MTDHQGQREPTGRLPWWSRLVALQAGIWPLLVVLGVRQDGQKILLAIKNMGGESEAAWRGVLDDLIARGLKTPDFIVVDGGAGLEKALCALWPTVPTQRCTVHKHRNLLAHAPERLHDEVTADYHDMIYAESAQEILVLFPWTPVPEVLIPSRPGPSAGPSCVGP